MTPADKEKMCCGKCRVVNAGINCCVGDCECHTTASDRTYHVGGAVEVASGLDFEEECGCGTKNGLKFYCMKHTFTKVEVGEWEEEFYKLAKTMDGQYRPRLKVLIEELRQRAYEEGEGYGRNDEADRCEKHEKVAFEAGKQAMREELREKVASSKAGSDFNPISQLGDEDIRRGWNRALDNISNFLKDTGSSNR